MGRFFSANRICHLLILGRVTQKGGGFETEKTQIKSQQEVKKSSGGRCLGYACDALVRRGASSSSALLPAPGQKSHLAQTICMGRPNPLHHLKLRTGWR